LPGKGGMLATTKARRRTSFGTRVVGGFAVALILCIAVMLLLFVLFGYFYAWLATGVLTIVLMWRSLTRRYIR